MSPAYPNLTKLEHSLISVLISQAQFLQSLEQTPAISAQVQLLQFIIDHIEPSSSPSIHNFSSYQAPPPPTDDLSCPVCGLRLKLIIPHGWACQNGHGF